MLRTYYADTTVNTVRHKCPALLSSAPAQQDLVGISQISEIIINSVQMFYSSLGQNDEI